MRRILLATIAALGLVACSANPAHIEADSKIASPEPGETTPVPEPTPEPEPAPEPVVAAAPDTSVSSGNSMSNTPAVAAPLGPPCEQEIALTCAPGLSDGCLRTDATGAAITKVHVCIQVTPSMEYTPCSQEIAQVCGAGMRDACLLKPAPSDKHVCVKL